MDPQMVWDMMDECDAQDTPAPSPCAVSDKKAEAPPEPEVSCKTTSGFMGFSLFGLPRQIDMTVVKAASCWIKRFSPCVAPKGHVLDLACGTGRHGRLFLDNANKVTFVDRDINGVQDLENRPNVDIRQCDLEDGRDWPFAPNNFDAIIVANYLYRPHLSALAPTLQNGGVLLYETFAQGNEKLGRPKNPDFLLTSHELLDLARLSGLHVVAFEQGRDGDKIVQRLCAVKGGALAQYTL